MGLINITLRYHFFITLSKEGGEKNNLRNILRFSVTLVVVYLTWKRNNSFNNNLICKISFHLLAPEGSQKIIWETIDDLSFTFLEPSYILTPNNKATGIS